MLKLIAFLRPFSRYLLIAWVLAIFSVSSAPSIPVLKIHTAKAEIRLDYLIHFCEYGSLAFLTFLTFSGKEFRISAPKYLIISAGLICFALFDEFHQKLIPGRTFNVNDIISDITGIAGGVLFCIVTFRMLVKKPPVPLRRTCHLKGA
jgi:VanZ family protein